MKLWGLVGMVLPTAHTTQQKNCELVTFKPRTNLIGQVIFCNVLTNIHFHLTRFQPHILLTYPPSISYFLYESLSLHYESYTTMGKNAHKLRHTLSVGVCVCVCVNAVLILVIKNLELTNQKF